MCSPDAVLTWFGGLDGGDANEYQVLVLKDFQKFLAQDGQPAAVVEHQVVRLLRNLAQEFKSEHKVIVLLGTTLELPNELQKVVTVIDWPLPEKVDIRSLMDKMLTLGKQRDDLAERFRLDYDEHEMDEIVSAFQGLTLTEIELLATYMMLKSPEFSPKLIGEKKRDIIRKAGLIDWIDVTKTIENVGGMHNLKDWLHKRRDAFSAEAAEYGLPPNPKGLLLIGVQGAGKSLFAQAVASFFKLPMLRLDMGRVFSGIVGSSEENIRDVIKVAESVAPCCLWLDEIDKAFSGIGSSNQTDGGTTARVFGTILTWMQEKNSQVFLVATANDVSQLPPELLRKGRLDEIFFVPLPNADDREEIFRIHLQARGRSPKVFDLKRLVAACDGFTGAEIEAAIVSAMYEAFDENRREFTTDDILFSLSETVPISVQMKEQIDALVKWAEKRTRNASIVPDKRPSRSSTVSSTAISLDLSDDEEL